MVAGGGAQVAARDGAQSRSDALPDGVRTLEQQHAAALAELAALRQELALVYASRSWKLTAPLRRCGPHDAVHPPRNSSASAPTADAITDNVCVILPSATETGPLTRYDRIASGVAAADARASGARTASLRPNGDRQHNDSPTPLMHEWKNLADTAIDERSWFKARLAGVEGELQAYRRSTSWRLTRPLRMLGYGVVRLRLVLGVLVYFHRKYPGFAAIKNGAAQARHAWQHGRLDGLKAALIFYYRQRAFSIRTAAPSDRTVRLAPGSVAADGAITDIAVHIHAYYVDLVPELLGYIRNINIAGAVTLYVTTDTEEKALAIRRLLPDTANFADVVIVAVENRGRDVAPLLAALGPCLVDHQLVLHVHTKKSPHNPELCGWRRYLLDTLAGSPEIVNAILHRFAADGNLGILYPAGYFAVRPLMRLGSNALWMQLLLRRARRPLSEMDLVDTTEFPAGMMFWCRGEALRSLADLQLATDDFEVEAGQVDGTLAHAIERMLPYFANLRGLAAKPYVLDGRYHEAAPGAMPLARDTLAAAREGHAGLHILFDHTAGGGTQLYRQRLIRDLVAQRHAVARVYYGEPLGLWLVDLATPDRTETFAVDDADALFPALGACAGVRIVVNSLYGFPDIDRIIDRIVALAATVQAEIEVKIHDFHAICPSPHLLDYRQRYCGIPKDLGACDHCLLRNLSAVWSSTDVPAIANWRAMFRKLLDAATTISVFDPSSITLLQRAYNLPRTRFSVVPHSDHYFSVAAPLRSDGPLHIGLLGTLTPAKGAEVVNDLARYMDEVAPDVPITLVGQTVVPTHARITVMGSYEVDDLPGIIQRTGINVCLLSSIVPETFSYTLSEIIKMELPVVAFDIGAQGRRTAAYPKGLVVPADSKPKAILEALRQVSSAGAEEPA